VVLDGDGGWSVLEPRILPSNHGDLWSPRTILKISHERKSYCNSGK
jgi:hypothetical protein